MYCKDIPYNEAKHEGKEKMAYGQWLRAEVKVNSPYWHIFYTPQGKSAQIEEVVPETPPVQISTVPLLPPPSIIPAANTSIAVHSNREPTIIPAQPLQNPSDEHHTAIISFLPPKFLPYRHLVLIIARYS